MNGATVDTPKGRGTVVGKMTVKFPGKLIVWLDADRERLERKETDIMETYAFWPDECKEVE